MKPIVVQMSGCAWTEKALHVACAMARCYAAPIILARMMQVQHVGWLGADFAYEPLAREESSALVRYEAIAAKYGVEFEMLPMQYATLVGALVSLVDELGAESIFADVPHSLIPGWRKLQIWDLRRQLEARTCMLYTLDQPVQPVVIAELENLKHSA